MQPIFYNYKWSITFKNCESQYYTPVNSYNVVYQLYFNQIKKEKENSICHLRFLSTIRSISQESKWTLRHSGNYFSRKCPQSVDREVVRPSSFPISSPRLPPKKYHHDVPLPRTTVILVQHISLLFKTPMEQFCVRSQEEGDCFDLSATPIQPIQHLLETQCFPFFNFIRPKWL